MATDELFSSGYRALVDGDYENARRLLQSYVDKKRKDAHAWSLLASACLRLGELEKAEEACAQAIRLEPNEGTHYKKQGIVRDLAGDPSGACEALSQALKLGRSDSATLALLGKSQVLLGRFREAVESLEQAAEPEQLARSLLRGGCVRRPGVTGKSAGTSAIHPGCARCQSAQRTCRAPIDGIEQDLRLKRRP